MGAVLTELTWILTFKMLIETFKVWDKVLWALHSLNLGASCRKMIKCLACFPLWSCNPVSELTMIFIFGILLTNTLSVSDKCFWCCLLLIIKAHGLLTLGLNVAKNLTWGWNSSAASAKASKSEISDIHEIVAVKWCQCETCERAAVIITDGQLRAYLKLKLSSTTLILDL